MRRSCRFQSAQAINYSLNHLYELVARDRISARRASTLAYIRAACSSALFPPLTAISLSVSGMSSKTSPQSRRPLPTQL